MESDYRRELTRRNNFLRHMMPYCFQKMAHAKGAHVYLPLNRDYKPIGYAGVERVDYEDYEHFYVKFKRCPTTIKGVWVDGSKSSALWLYNDSLDSRDGYFERLCKVLSRTINY